MIKSVRWLVLAVAAVAGTLVVTDDAFGGIFRHRRGADPCCQPTCCAPVANPCCSTCAPVNPCGSCCNTGYAHHTIRHHHANPCCNPCGYVAAAPACCGGTMTLAVAAMPAPPTAGVAPMPLPTAQPGAPAPVPMGGAPVVAAPMTGGCCGSTYATASAGCGDECCDTGRHRRRLFRR
jgi:hypothetical protein